MINFRKLILPALLLAISLTAKTQEEAVKLVILHTNDMHSRLEGFSPSGEYTPLTVNDDRTVGGFSRLAAIIASEKARLPEGTLVLDDGDFLMGTIFHYMEEYNGFQLRLMNEMGYDLVALGNHEFDYGPAKLAKIINASAEGGAIPQLVLSNAVFDDTEAGDDDLQSLFNSGVIKATIIVERNGVRIGLFSLMGKDADDVAPFALPVTFEKQVKAARRAVRELENQGADIIICLSHSGVSKDKKGEWSGEDVKLARKVKNIDLIISGHTHTVLGEAVMVKGTPIVQAGSFARNLGRVEISIEDGKLSVDNYRLIPINDNVAGDAAIEDKIDQQKELIREKLFVPLAYEPFEPLVETGFELVCDEYGGDLENSNLGPLVVDAIHSYINSNTGAGSDVTMVATGVIRDNIPPGTLSIQDIFRVMSLGSGSDNVPGYALARVYLSGNELKKVLEVLLFSSKSSPSNYCYYSGIEAEINPEKGILRKVQSVSIIDTDGNRMPVDISKEGDKLYSVSANAYMLKMIGVIKKSTFGLVKVYPKHPDGTVITDMDQSIIDFNPAMEGIQEGKEWIALVEYLKNMSDTDGNGIPELDEFYRKPPLRLKPVADK